MPRPALPARALLPVIIIGVCLQNVASHAQPSPVQPAPVAETVPPPALSEALSATWPLAVGVSALIGVEPHDRGNPLTFGVAAELLWKARLGGFAALLASEGTPIIVQGTVNGVTQPSFADRISVPFGFAARPLATIGLRRRDYWGRLLTAIGLQVGLTIENFRLSDSDQTTAGLHLGAGFEVPLWGGTREGGIALRLYGRLIVTPSVTFVGQATPNSPAPITAFEPIASGQLFAGLTYYP